MFTSTFRFTKNDSAFVTVMSRANSIFLGYFTSHATIGAFVIFENPARFSSPPSTRRGKFINVAGNRRRLSQYLIGYAVSLIL